jgi:tRNA pseudouridine38-40 synthase
VRNLRLLVQYAGTRYAGWQLQPGVPTIQGALEQSLSTVVRHPVRLVAASRTDAGAHARGQVASVRVDTELPNGRIQHSLNALLPHDIRVAELLDAPDDFHALSDAVRREYRYVIVNGTYLSPFRHGFAHLVRVPLELDRLREAAGRVVGEHDFTGFSSADRGEVRTLRRVEVSEWMRQEEALVYRVVADGFLRGMVRALVGTFVDVGRGLRKVSRIDAILAQRDRRQAGPCVPACGLFLERVEYDEQ